MRVQAGRQVLHGSAASAEPELDVVVRGGRGGRCQGRCDATHGVDPRWAVRQCPGRLSTGEGRGRGDGADDGDASYAPAHRGCQPAIDRKSTRLNSSHVAISYAVFCLKKKTQTS